MPSGATVQLSRQIGHHLRVFLAVELDEQRIVRRDRVDQRERRAAVAIVVRRLGHDAEVEHAALLGRLRAAPRRADASARAARRRVTAEYFVSSFLSLFIASAASAYLVQA